MKRKDLVIGETYKTSRYLKAVYLGEVRTYKTGGSVFQQRTIGSEHGTLTPAFAVSFGYNNGDGWSPEFLSLQTIDCTWAQWDAMRQRQQAAIDASIARDRERSLLHTAQAKTLARMLGPGVSVEVDQYGYARVNAQQLIDRLTVKVSA